MIDHYVNLDLKFFDHAQSAEGERFAVQVEQSPVGAPAFSETVVVPAGLRERLARLEQREFDADDAALIAVGTEIGALLLPPRARAYFTSSLARLLPKQGLRLRIKCSAVALERMPWEFAYVECGLDDAGAAQGRRGFIAGERRLSIVRYELGSELLAAAEARIGAWRLLAVACEPLDRRDPANPLQIELELENLQGALGEAKTIEIVGCRPPTRATMQDLLLAGAEIFHFAGHGEFRAAEAEGSAAESYLLLELADGNSDQWKVDALAQRLASRGIQLAVLGACRSAKGDAVSSWAGIAQSLVRAGIPAVIGMQYTVFDPSAIAFSKMLYRAWARGSELDEAVAEARSAIADLKGTGRDFATPVLYLRAGSMRVPALQGPGEVATEPSLPLPPAAPDLTLTLAQIAQLYDYKLVHDALHSARTGPFSLIQLRAVDFPAGSTGREIAKHTRDLRMRLQDVRRVAEQGRCDATLMQEVVDELAGAIATLEEALAERAVDKLEDALAAFDTLLNTQPARVDTWMMALAKGLMIEPLVDFLRGVGDASDLQVADEMKHCGEQLRKGAAMHTICQSIDNRLTVIRKAAEAQRFREIRRQWKPLSDSLTRILPDWTADGGDRLRRNTLELDRGVAANDQPAADAVFDDFCGDFDFGFYTVDSDLKQLCGEMKERTATSLAGVGHRRAAGA